MKVLIITHHRLVNQFTGAISRIKRLAQELAANGARVTVLALVSPKLTPMAPVELGSGCVYHEVSNTLQWLDSISRRLGFPSYALASHLNQLLPLSHCIEEEYEVVIAETPWVWKIAKRTQARLKILSTHNHEATYHDHYRPFFLRPVIWAEQRALREADMVVAVTEDDRKLFQRVIPNKPIHIIPNGFDRHSKSSDAQTSFNKNGKKRAALFLASHSVHNLRALKALRSIFSKPAVSKNWSLWVVGNINPSFELPPNTLKLGPQKNLSDIFSQAEIALNPILSGSGSNVKLIESLGNGCPVLSTPIGARGFPPELSGLHIEDIHNFEERLQSAVPWQKPKVSELARYQWQEIGSQYCQLIQPYLNS